MACWSSFNSLFHENTQEKPVVPSIKRQLLIEIWLHLKCELLLLDKFPYEMLNPFKDSLNPSWPIPWIKTSLKIGSLQDVQAKRLYGCIYTAYHPFIIKILKILKLVILFGKIFRRLCRSHDLWWETGYRYITHIIFQERSNAISLNLVIICTSEVKAAKTYLNW